MALRETKMYFENAFCHGCLSFGRRCTADIGHATLFYQILDPIHTLKEPISLILCWECEATLRKIRLFQYKANKAQARLQDVITHKIEHKSLSTLKSISKNTYDLSIDTETSEAQPSSCLNKYVARPVLNQLKLRDFKIQKIPTKKDGATVKVEDVKIDHYKSEDNLGCEKMEKEVLDDKYTITQDERFSLDKTNTLQQFKDLKVVIKRSDLIQPQPDVKIKEEIDDYYSDNCIDDDHITLDVEAKEIESETLLKPNKPKKKKFDPYKRNRARRILIDYDNVEKYFHKIVLSPEAHSKQLSEWAKDKEFRSNKKKCVPCALTFKNKSELQSHNDLHDQISEHRCDQCNLNFRLAEELDQHIAEHEFDQCTICLCVCRSPRDREDHLKVFHRRGYYKCDMCTLTFRLQKQITIHKEKLHRMFICDYCNAKRNSKDVIAKHIFANHMQTKLSCHLCPRKYKRKTHLTEHLIDVHKMGGLSNTTEEEAFCVECNKQFTTKLKYKYHLNTSVRHVRGVKKVQIPCPACGKIFTKKTYLNNHFNLYHGDGSKHRCEPCQKSYATGFGLRQHIARFHKKIPIPRTKVCETCGLAFQSNRVLLHHVRTHTGERPYECSYCPSRFAQKYARNVHVRNVHLKRMEQFIN